MTLDTSRPLRLGLVGAGGIAKAHVGVADDFPKRVRYSAVCDVNTSAAELLAARVGGAAVFTDLAEMLRYSDLDAVDLCTPHYQHAEQAIQAARADKHVLVEKPMACSMDECRAMVSAAEASGVTLMVAQYQRYDPSYSGVKRKLDSGELGTIRAVRLDAMQNLSAFMPPSHWLFDGKLAGGGIVISVLVHRIDLMRWLLGPVKRVSAVCKTTRPEFTNGAEDYAWARLEFASGAVAEVFGTYSGFRVPWGESFTLFGDAGAMHAVPPLGEYVGPAWYASQHSEGEKPLSWATQLGGFLPVPEALEGLPSPRGFYNQILHFEECIRSGIEPLSSGRDNLGTMAVIFGIYESSRTGQPVDLELLPAEAASL